MTSRAPGTPAAIRTASAPLAFVALSLACVWDPWIPGDGPWDPQIVVDPANLAYRLVLDTTYVDELDCYARLCRQRFRVVVPEPGILTVRVIPELVSQDDQARMVLESSRGVLARAESGRGPRSDPIVLAVREQVESATFFVLLESVGGKVPYQITASLTPGDGPDAAAGAGASREPEPPRPVDPPPKLVEINLPGGAGGGYDPATSFSSLRTFTFPPSTPAADRAPGTPLESPVDRQIRRLLTDELERKGFRQASGRETADMLVDFSLGESTKNVPVMSLVQDWYDVSGLQWANGPASRGTLTVDILEKQSSRIAWRAWTTKGLGPGVVHGETQTAYLREAVSEVLVNFPPR